MFLDSGCCSSPPIILLLLLLFLYFYIFIIGYIMVPGSIPFLQFAVFPFFSCIFCFVFIAVKNNRFSSTLTHQPSLAPDLLDQNCTVTVVSYFQSP
jgi:Ca2+/Na+ antiporter